VSAVERSWAKAAALGAEPVGVLLFRNIFEIAPEAVNLFSFKDEKDLYESDKLKGHGLKVVNTTSAAVAGLRTLPELVPVLQELGTKHVGYAVLPAHYDVVGQALIKTLKTGLGKDFTPEVEAAWAKLWPIIATTMQGEHYKGGQQTAETAAEKEQPAEKPTEKKPSDKSTVKAAAKPKSAKVAAEKSSEKAAESSAALTEADIAVIEETWGKAAGLGVEAVGVLLFRQIFEIAPEALQLFSFKDEPDLYESPKLKSHASGVVTFVGKAVAGLKDLKTLAPVLQELGMKHVGYGVVRAHYDVVGQALLRTLKLGLTEAYNDEVEASWKKLWAIVTDAMNKKSDAEPVAKSSNDSKTSKVKSSSRKTAAAKEAEQKAAKEAEEAPAKAGKGANSGELSEADVAIIKATWAKAAGLGVETVGVLLFSNIFSIAPEALGLFPFKAEYEKEKEQSELLKKHSVKVVEAVATAIDNLEQKDVLVPYLVELGVKHVGFKTLPPHYDVVGEALIKTLKYGLKDDYTPEANAAWTKLWAIIAKTMIGNNYHSEVKKKAEPKTADTKKKASSKQKAASHRSASTLSMKSNPSAPLTEAEIGIIEKSWKMVEALGAETVGVLLFKQIFNAAPQALQLFPSLKDEKNLYESAALKKHGTTVVTTVSKAVGGLRNLGELAPVLQDLGARHAGYNVLPEHYDVVGDALFKSLKIGLQEAFSGEVEAAWKKLWDVLSKTMMGELYTGGAKAKADSGKKKSTKDAAPAGAEAQAGGEPTKKPEEKKTLTEAEAKHLTKEFLEAAKAGKTPDIERLMSDGLSVNATDNDGNTALHFAAEEGNLEVVNALLAAGADPTLQVKLGEWGYTPLHHAARKGHKEIAEALVKADKKGKALRVKNRQGKIPADIASSKLRSWLKKLSKDDV
jgi:hemoglobin-like flavoprotein